MTRTKHSKVLEQMHELLIGALRSREQEVFMYLAILGPALAGFGWLLYKQPPAMFVFWGTCSVLLLLLLGAFYSLSLGYNFRYITLELAKLETILGIRSAMLIGWPKSRCDFLERRWCSPPDVIAAFWYAFLAGILWVTITTTAYYLYRKEGGYLIFVVDVIGIQFFLFGLAGSRCYACKLRSLAEKEPENWVELEDEVSNCPLDLAV
jgi:hypothetical protein